MNKIRLMKSALRIALGLGTTGLGVVALVPIEMIERSFLASSALVCAAVAVFLLVAYALDVATTIPE